MTPQLTDNSLSSLDFKNFARILSALVPGFSGGALYDLSSNNLWISASLEKSAKAEIELFMETQEGNWASDVKKDFQPQRISGDYLLFPHTLSDHTQEPIGTLILLIQTKSDVDVGALEKKMTAAINAIAAIISGEYQLNAELNAMANELTERYEELNLVYDTGDHASSFSAVKRALRQLVENSCVYMDVPFAAILLLDKKIYIEHIRDQQALDKKGLLDPELNRLYLWTLEKNVPLVLNDENDPVWGQLKIDLPYKLLSCPVTDKIGNNLGILVALKERSAEDFFNSDRNLLMVMANKASKVIQTNYDSLTGLLNLQAFKYFLKKIHFSASQLVPVSHTVLYIDMDHIQVINENLGHQAGDEVLRSTGKLIKRLIRDIDIAARLSGDKFGVLLYNCSPDRGMAISKRISEDIKNQELMWNGKKVQLSACIGLASITANTQSTMSALDEAEIACNAAKEEGKSRISFFKFGDVDLTGLKEEMRWAQMLEESLSKNNFKLYCQKIYTLQKESDQFRYEILLRALDDKGMILEPNKFIPAAERYKMMPAVDRWVISNSLGLLNSFWKNLQVRQNLWSINISGQSFRDETFLDFIVSSLQNLAIPPACICFEITETAAIGNLIAAQRLIQSLHELGCTIALDDFGSGLSSFTYLKNLNVDYLKIDGLIVKDIVENNISLAMVKAIQDVAGALQIKTVGEYAENEAITEELSRIGVDYAQGYFIGRPVPLENELENIIAAESNEEEGSPLETGREA
jgi:diguanylate cyclase (GGDEF)-like protein